MADFVTMSTGGFPLGLDWSKNPESIPDGALVQAENTEYDHADGALRTVAGVTIKLDVGMTIDTLFYDHRHSVFYFSSGTSLYRTDLATYTALGALEGASRPVYCRYGEVCLVASGGLLQSIVGGTVLSTLIGSPPVSHYVTSRAGRVIAFSTASDIVNYSAIGDHTSWTNVSSDTSSAQFVNVGYKDPGNIIAIDFLSKVMVVYKQYGRAYKIISAPEDTTNFAVEPVSETASCLSMFATVNIDGYSLYLGQAGLMAFIPTQDYGDVAPREVGLNINAWIAKNIDSNCQLWHVQSKKQIWVKTQNDKRVYLYHYIPRYDDGRGAFTVRSFTHDISDVCEVGSDVYVAYGGKISILNMLVDTDDGVQLQTVIKGANRLAKKHAILIMSKLLITRNIIAGYGTLTIGKKSRTVTFSASGQKIYFNTAKLYSSALRLYSSAYTRYYKVSGGSNKSVQITLIVPKGAVAIRQLDYDYLEV
ncbi:hypothetical protein SPSIL_015210 [Sporomusa silvacetica DSM 10669]|uniref:Bacteriophage P22, Gp10, DNA-stabilising n=1 Tax=Sporomusa silvacetica DSM 10669 TaxID=1123289 RepID=A0ABZ3IIA0_9FIRM|nr:hypothetical protein [Sporomusa silvacetica]OZC21583.1 hypothetical protein SPSIL_09940 [Sporomusa silvacetica DSM 10669]